MATLYNTAYMAHFVHANFDFAKNFIYAGNVVRNCGRRAECDKMPTIRCVECGHEILVDVWSAPYNAEIACPSCRTNMQVYVGAVGQGSIVKRKYPSFEELKEIRDALSGGEKNQSKKHLFHWVVVHIPQAK
jgi:phage FluMu protein Com